ncbi:hypothetical protein COU75_00110 [Candidatus Peregrinibacteria bacterium CG10_big_fil_rev_8_21_14_0_10_42_8]|nr:MAG: hypothetical protein COU75_00110 [Candidatus Peregrinibacteria bacterium CG10_big_fil_rev_8_21_14_0_10_42_8]
MMTLTDIQEQLEKLDLQIIKLLDERTHICAGHSLSADDKLDMLSLWLEEAADRGLDEVRVEKIGKLAIAMCSDTPE